MVQPMQRLDGCDVHVVWEAPFPHLVLPWLHKLGKRLQRYLQIEKVPAQRRAWPNEEHSNDISGGVHWAHHNITAIAAH